MASDFMMGDGFVAWSLDGEEGARVGEGFSECQRSIARLEKDYAEATDPGDREFIAVEIAAARWFDASTASDNEVGLGESHYLCYNRRLTRELLRICKAALKAERSAQKNRPWPEWAKEAAVAGWKPPEGWKP